MSTANTLPKAEGFYWGKWKIKAEGTSDPDDPPGDEWEVMHVVENCLDETDDEFLMVMVPGVDKWQAIQDFFWGPGPLVVPDDPNQQAECQCPRCGRLHKRSHLLPATLGGELNHQQYCRLSRVLNKSAEMGLGTPDHLINEWLTRKIADAHERERG